ncbi:MAG: 4Fe-4S dicluster domain-containing protein [Ruminococcaceae bacterium]|nr:4Fe-4S dicluster domain-containing protein [Oscillospiraceae bacterium]
MKRIDYISNLDEKCTGCMACVDACPAGCIFSIIKNDGFRYSTIDTSKCILCGKCYAACPLAIQEKHTEEQHLYAAYSSDRNEHNNGSSGGIFEGLAKYFLEQGYYVCGASFEGTTLNHKVINKPDELNPLLKSKYIQSDTEGIYNQILELLKKGKKVFFCGTPCQVSAMINSTPATLRNGLFTADIICHGVPSQKVFDEYIGTLEKKHGGTISDFSFRIKDNKYRHAHGYSYRVTKNGKITVKNGIYTNSTFYNAFKNYLIFRDGCYNCQYATLQRVSDITLADFWGIEKYDFKGNVDSGVSMVITNTPKGQDAFVSIQSKIVSKEFPVQYGIDSNYCLTHRTDKPNNRDVIIEEIATNGYEEAARKYFKCRIIHKMYWLIPARTRRFIRKIRGN